MSSFNKSNFNAANQFCGFCRRNKEPDSICRSHRLKDDNGLVVCPQLYKYRCELCGATGPEAHTRSYCPVASGLRRQVQQRDKATHNNKSRHNSSGKATGGGGSARSRTNSSSSGSLQESQHGLNQLQQQHHHQQQQHIIEVEQQEDGDEFGDVDEQNIEPGAHGGNGDDEEPGIQIGNDRMFRNMARVTNTRYNSAGKLRRPLVSYSRF